MFLYGILGIAERGKKLDYKLIAIDMDGTLLNSRNEISKRTRDAILNAGDKGVHVVLATGRLLTSAKNYSSKIDLKRPIISSNGAVIIDENENVIFEKHIDKSQIENITYIADKNDVYYHFYGKDSFYSNRYVKDIVEFYNPEGSLEEDKVKFNLYNHIGDILNKDIDIYKFIFIEDDVKKLYKLREELQIVRDVNISSSWINNVEIMEKDVSKGNSLRYLCEKLNINKDEIIAIGDNENDLSMLNFAGLGVSMGNANKNVKSAADIITSTNDEDGVAKIIEKYIL